MGSQVKTMLALFVPEGFSAEWANQQMRCGGFDKGREVLAVAAFDIGTGDITGEWWMQEVISKIH